MTNGHFFENVRGTWSKFIYMYTHGYNIFLCSLSPFPSLSLSLPFCFVHSLTYFFSPLLYYFFGQTHCHQSFHSFPATHAFHKNWTRNSIVRTCWIRNNETDCVQQLIFPWMFSKLTQLLRGKHINNEYKCIRFLKSFFLFRVIPQSQFNS